MISDRSIILDDTVALRSPHNTICRSILGYHGLKLLTICQDAPDRYLCYDRSVRKEYPRHSVALDEDQQTPKMSGINVFLPRTASYFYHFLSFIEPNASVVVRLRLLRLLEPRVSRTIHTLYSNTTQAPSAF